MLFGALQADLAAAFRTPEQLQLLLVALQRFPHTLKPKKLKKLLGSSTIINADNTPKYDHCHCSFLHPRKECRKESRVSVNPLRSDWIRSVSSDTPKPC